MPPRLHRVDVFFLRSGVGRVSLRGRINSKVLGLLLSRLRLCRFLLWHVLLLLLHVLLLLLHLLHLLLLQLLLVIVLLHLLQLLLLLDLMLLLDLVLLLLQMLLLMLLLLLLLLLLQLKLMLLMQLLLLLMVMVHLLLLLLLLLHLVQNLLLTFGLIAVHQVRHRLVPWENGVITRRELRLALPERRLEGLQHGSLQGVGLRVRLALQLHAFVAVLKSLELRLMHRGGTTVLLPLKTSPLGLSLGGISVDLHRRLHLVFPSHLHGHAFVNTFVEGHLTPDVHPTHVGPEVLPPGRHGGLLGPAGRLHGVLHPLYWSGLLIGR